VFSDLKAQTNRRGLARPTGGRSMQTGFLRFPRYATAARPASRPLRGRVAAAKRPQKGPATGPQRRPTPGRAAAAAARPRGGRPRGAGQRSLGDAGLVKRASAFAVTRHTRERARPDPPPLVCGKSRVCRGSCASCAAPDRKALCASRTRGWSAVTLAGDRRAAPDRRALCASRTRGWAAVTLVGDHRAG